MLCSIRQHSTAILQRKRCRLWVLYTTFIWGGVLKAKEFFPSSILLQILFLALEAACVAFCTTSYFLNRSICQSSLLGPLVMDFHWYIPPLNSDADICKFLNQLDFLTRKVRYISLEYWILIYLVLNLYRVYNSFPQYYTAILMYKDDFFFFLQYLKFSILDWTKPSQDPLDQESMGSMECSLAEILAASSKARFERGLTPFRHTLGMYLSLLDNAPNSTG